MDRFGRADHLYILGAMLIVVGTVIQDVVADAMSTEVVSRVDPAGIARPEDEIRAELGMVQVLGRLALGIGILCGGRIVRMARPVRSPAKRCFCSASSFPPSRRWACC